MRTYRVSDQLSDGLIFGRLFQANENFSANISLSDNWSLTLHLQSPNNVCTDTHV